MKKSLFYAGMFSMILTFGFLAAGCATAGPSVAANTANISGYVALDSSQYTILGNVSASSRITVDKAKGLTTGDTMNYGYIGDEDNALSIGEASSVTSSSFYGLVKSKTTVVTTPQGPAHKARANAAYELIQQAKAKGADAIIHITTDVKRSLDAKTNIETVTVDITGIAIKVN
ncbi:MAG: heavy metal-binding domain-containing protein [Treponema sp.]|nr:heavy metal-binding domain-containing protein [Treponema sp.]